MYITQNLARRILGQRLVLNIDPTKVYYHVGSIRPLTKNIESSLSRHLPVSLSRLLLGRKARKVGRIHPFILRSSQFPPRELVTGMSKHNKIHDFFVHLDDYTQSLWYREIIAGLTEHGQVMHKKIVMKSAADVDRFFQDYVLKMFRSMRDRGYDLEKGAQIGRAMIGRDGDIHIANQAGHRFSIAREVGVKRFPLVIRCVHQEWVESMNLTALMLPGKRKWTEALEHVERQHR